MDLSDDEMRQRADADRRKVDPPIQVKTAMWSKAGQLNAVRTAVSGGSELLIFVPRAAHSHDLCREPCQPIPSDWSQSRQMPSCYLPSVEWLMEIVWVNAEVCP